jgi:hypothetical protein
MILLHLSKINFSLIGKGFYYFQVTRCTLDVPSLKTINWNPQFPHINQTQQVVMRCSLYQIKVYL